MPGELEVQLIPALVADDAIDVEWRAGCKIFPWFVRRKKKGGSAAHGRLWVRDSAQENSGEVFLDHTSNSLLLAKPPPIITCLSSDSHQEAAAIGSVQHRNAELKVQSTQTIKMLGMQVSTRLTEAADIGEDH